MRKLLYLRAAAISLAALSISTAAFAGEVKGSNGGEYIKGSPTAPLDGNSICAFSGLNDEFYILDDPTAARTQSYGQLVSKGSDFFNPQNYNSPDADGPISNCNPS